MSFDSTNHALKHFTPKAYDEEHVMYCSYIQFGLHSKLGLHGDGFWIIFPLTCLTLLLNEGRPNEKVMGYARNVTDLLLRIWYMMKG